MVVQSLAEFGVDMGAGSKQGLDYSQAGVDIEKGNRLVERIKSTAAATHNANVLSGLGGFGGLFELPITDYKQPVLVSGTDGVGTKLKLAIDAGMHEGIGIDLVAMCVNDLIVCGAKPLFFLDYYATGELDLTVAQAVIKSIGLACEQTDMALIGGETAEMPGMYQRGDYDLAGFAVGIVEKEKILSGDKVNSGDCLLAIESSGFHANGYSLIRKIIDVAAINLTDHLDGKSIIEHLLTPTRLYVKAVHALLNSVDVHALAHITGGGLTENLPRVLPEYHQASIDLSTWSWPAVFTFFQQQGDVETLEMLKTFNCGVGMVAVVGAEEVNKSKQVLAAQGLNCWVIGEIEQSQQSDTVVVYRGL